MVKANAGAAAVREMSNRWEGNHEYTGPTKLPASETAASAATPAALVQKKINPNDPTGLVPQKVD